MSIKRRKRINRAVYLLSNIYNREYREVQRIYNKFGGDIGSTKQILNMLKYEGNMGND